MNIKSQIKQITLHSKYGLRQYDRGSKVPLGEDIIDRIEVSEMYFNGDPFQHYCGYDKDGLLLFHINPLTPCEIIWDH